MNVGHPSNMARIIAIYGGIMDETGVILQSPDLERMKKDFYGISVSDKVTRETIFSCYNDHHVLLEPHGAVAWKGLQCYLADDSHEVRNGNVYISLETAHPAKFPDEILRILNFMPGPPPSLKKLAELDEDYHFMENDYSLFRDYIHKTL